MRGKIFAEILFLCGMSVFAQASLVLGFNCITNNHPVHAAIGKTQLFVEVSPYSSNKAEFTFYNTGPAECVISEIYFESGILSAFVSINESLRGVDYEKPDRVSPGNLPGANTISPKFVAAQYLSIEPENPEPKWGVGPNEWVKLVYTVGCQKTFDDLATSLQGGQMRIGIHVIGFCGDGSESFVNVPEPTFLGLTVLAAGLLKLRKRIQN